MIRALNRWFATGVFLLGLCAYIVIYANGLAPKPIRSDGISYYAYLPGIVLFDDPGLTALADDCCGGRFPEYTGLSKVPGTRRWLNPHPVGVAILMLPFFLVAHALTLWSNFTPDGFSFYYQHAAGLSGLFWVALGLSWLRRWLSQHFGAGVVLATLATIVFGTNLFHYGTYDAGYSHGYSFALVSALVLVVPRWFAAPTLRRSALLGLVAGLIVLVRHANALVLLYPVLYGLGMTESMKARLEFVQTHWRPIAAVVISGLVTLTPQLAIYKMVTGTWRPNPYGQLDIGFDFLHPHLFGVLLSPTKGLFFWSPLLLCAVIGFGLVRGELRASRRASVVVLVLLTWVIASWGDWQFGGSYGHRGYTDVLAFFAIGLASLFAWIGHQTAPVRFGATGIVTALVLLSIFQMVQYWLGIVPFNDTTWEQYRALFLRLS